MVIPTTPQAQLPPTSSAWADPATGRPTKEFALYMQSLNQAFQAIAGSLGSLAGGSGLFLQKSLNLSDVASASASRINLGILNGSSQYVGFDGQLIANVQTYNVSSLPKVLTVMTANLYNGSGALGNFGGVPGSWLGWTYFTYNPGSYGGPGPSVDFNWLQWPSIPGSWQNITGLTLNGFWLGVFVRYA